MRSKLKKIYLQNFSLNENKKLMATEFEYIHIMRLRKLLGFGIFRLLLTNYRWWLSRLEHTFFGIKMIKVVGLNPTADIAA